MRLRVLIVTAFCCSGVIAILSSCVRSLKPSDSTDREFTHGGASSSARTNIEAASLQFRDWIKESWNTNSFESGSRFAGDKDSRTKTLVLEKFFSNRRSMSEIELREFRRMLEDQARAKSDDPYVVAASVRTLAGLLDYLEVKGLVSKADIAPDEELFVSYLENAALDLQVRGAAIRAVGDLRVENGKKYIEALLLDSANIDTPEIARNGCLALVKLSNEEAFAPIRGVFERTSDSAVFGTAAFCFGEINNVDAMSILVKNISRFPDSESCDAALVKMDAVIFDTLNDPQSPAIMDAIQATEHLWKDGQRDKYVPLLKRLLASSAVPVKRACCSRLIDVASRLPLAQEKRDLSVLLDSIDQSPELSDYVEKIRKRMNATVLAPTTATMSVATMRKE